jgi:hypothetical protein
MGHSSGGTVLMPTYQNGSFGLAFAKKL